jgi:outer membrane protein assembly factor BamE
MRIFITLLAAIAIAGCKQNPELPSAISPYKIDIQQGNVVTQEMVGKLKAGLTRSQVRFVLGSPLVTDMFHSDRWDYIYLMQRQGKPDERRRLTVIFDGDKLLRLEGDVVITDKSLEPEPPPVAKPPAAAIAPAPKPAIVKPVATIPPPPKPADKPPVAATPVAKPAAAVVAPPVAKPEPAKSDAASIPSAPDIKPDAAKMDTKPETAVPAATADAAKADATKADAAKPDVVTADEKKDPPKRGMFGRMLDKIGF